jgi:large subunit ribosomal protein L6
MSRVGKTPIQIPKGVKLQIQGNLVKVEGPKGKLQHTLPDGITVKQEGETLAVLRDDTVPKAAALHGTSRTVLNNLLQGCANAFVKELDIVGVGYRAATKGSVLQLTLGYSHQIDFQLPAGITAAVDKNTHLTLTGSDKVLLGRIAAQIRACRPPEPYQGKGVKYTSEVIVRKQGKAAGAK